jgi:hypothetical protein
VQLHEAFFAFTSVFPARKPDLCGRIAKAGVEVINTMN